MIRDFLWRRVSHLVARLFPTEEDLEVHFLHEVLHTETVQRRITHDEFIALYFFFFTYTLPPKFVTRWLHPAAYHRLRPIFLQAAESDCFLDSATIALGRQLRHLRHDHTEADRSEEDKKVVPFPRKPHV